MRGLQESFFKKWNGSDVQKFYEAHKEELFLGIRLNYINLYYRSASICRVESARRGLRCKIANKYLNRNNESGYSEISVDELFEKYEEIKKNIRALASPEKVAQQILIRNNNNNRCEGANWHCIDMEYIKKRNSRKEDLFGRFDIIAISRQKPYRTALIELKYGTGAIGGKSGVCKHANDFYQFLNKNEFENHLKGEICAIVNSYRELTASPLPKVCKEEFVSEPEIYFIALNNKGNAVRTKMVQCLQVTDHFDDEIKKWVICEDGSKGAPRFGKPIFLFSDLALDAQGDQLDINDIIDSDQYDRKGLIE